MRVRRLLVWLPLAAALAFGAAVGAAQLYDQLAERCDPLAPSAAGPVRQDVVLVVGGRACHGFGVANEATWPALLSATAPELGVVRYTRLRLGLRRALAELPNLLVENRPRVVLFQLGADEAFDDAIELSDIQRRRLDGYAFRWWLVGGGFGAAPPAPSVVGDWTVGPIRLSFFADGRMHFGEQTATWTADGDRITLSHAGGSGQEIRARIVGDQLHVIGVTLGGELTFSRGTGDETMIARCLRRLQAGDLIEPGLLLDGMLARGIHVAEARALAAQVDAIEGRAGPAPIEVEAPESPDPARLERDLLRAIAASRHYGAEPILVDLPVRIESLDALLDRVSKATGTRYIRARDALTADGLRGIDCTLEGHRTYARRVAAQLTSL